MRTLGNPDVLSKAGLAALLSAALCWPRLWTAPHRYSIWYLEAVLFLGGVVLWSFVFAWHTRFTRRPVFTLDIRPGLLVPATLGAAILALMFHLWFDPIFRLRAPRDYPSDFQQWIFMTLFSLAFTQLFLVFAPFAWLMRLTGKVERAVPLAIVFGLAVRAMQDHAAHSPLPPGLSLGLWSLRCATGLLFLYLYLRGGVLLVWWCALVMQCRHLTQIDL